MSARKDTWQERVFLFRSGLLKGGKGSTLHCVAERMAKKDGSQGGNPM